MNPAPFVIAKNPNPDSHLPFLLRLPVAGEEPLVLATAADWPGAKDTFCYQLDAWPEEAEVVHQIPVASCWRAGKAVHLMLERRLRRRSMFVWTQSKGRTLIFWRTQKTMQSARPGLKVPAARGLEAPLTIAVDLRETYAWRFGGQQVERVKRELPVGDYGVFRDDRLVAVVERKTAAGLAASALDGTLSFALAELETLPHACLVVESRLSDVMKAAKDHVRPGWLMSAIATLQVAHPRVHWVFAETRDLAEDFAFRWLAAALKAEDARASVRPGGKIPGVAEAGIDYGSAAPSGTLWGQPAQRTGEAVQRPLAVHDREGRLTEALAMARRGHVWTSSAYAEHFHVNQTTAWKDLTDLVAAGSLVAEGGRRTRRYRLGV